MITIPEALPLDTSYPSSILISDLENLLVPELSVSKSDSKADGSDLATARMPVRDKQVMGNILSIPTRLPALASLAKPETLFLSQVPYHIILQIRHNSISVQGSHQPSLQLLNDYFEKYARIDRNDSRKVRQITGSDATDFFIEQTY